ncbi:hypothetical protein K4A83_10390 [Spirulina subsalsa FACHB-351]|uniref:Uncharacterized protein n=1 Tax=Spirulina subsalsa FACHB-351 TaxID=234711 RepID=A0ABT3L580_9CYAN|nr:hypothetical protein [Spirulina subsalsa]MCW6036667.1 hypothetical protein [Spirulina subsalsa FACHB-351]
MFAKVEQVTSEEKTMPLIFMLAVLVVANWLVSQIMAIAPLALLKLLIPQVGGWVLLILVALFISWCFGD